jgi:ABC-2 type transport system permease protein
MLKQIAAFIRRDILIETGYRLSLTLNVCAVFSSILVYFFIDRMFSSTVSAHLEEFGVSYFSYVLLGMAFFSFTGSGLGSLPERLRQEQVQGTLEALLVCPLTLFRLVLYLGSSALLFAASDFIIYAALGIFVFGVNFSRAHLGSATIILILTVICFTGVGIISAAVIMRFKRGNLTGWLVNNLQAILGGVYFPVSVLPGWLQDISRFMPLTHAVRAFQRAVYTGATPQELLPEILSLAVFAALLLPLGALSLRLSLSASQSDGSLGQY